MKTLTSQAFATLCYQEMESLFAVCGYPRDPAWTVEEYIDTLRKRNTRLAVPATSIGNSFSRIRYELQPAAYEPDREALYEAYLRASRVNIPLPRLFRCGALGSLMNR
jgi:hypothetical protein